MPASITDKLTLAGNGTRPVSTTVTTLRAAAATSLICADLTGWPTTTACHFVTYKIDGNSKIVVGSQVDWKGIVTGSTINSLTVTGGTDAGNAVGDIVEILPTAAWGNDTIQAMQAAHDQDGTLKDGAVDGAGVLASNVVTTAKILDANVTTAKIANANVTADKLATGANTAYVATSETKTAGAYADLTTTTDTVTVTIGANGLALVSISSQMQNDTANAVSFVGFAVSGASTVVAQDRYAIIHQSYVSGSYTKIGATFLLIGLTAGSTTFKMKYAVSGNTSTFSIRNIAVIPL